MSVNCFALFNESRDDHMIENFVGFTVYCLFVLLFFFILQTNIIN